MSSRALFEFEHNERNERQDEDLGLPSRSSHAKVLVKVQIRAAVSGRGITHSCLLTMIIKHSSMLCQTLLRVLYTGAGRFAGHLISPLPFSVAPRRCVLPF